MACYIETVNHLFCRIRHNMGAVIFVLIPTVPQFMRLKQQNFHYITSIQISLGCGNNSLNLNHIIGEIMFWFDWNYLLKVLDHFHIWKYPHRSAVRQVNCLKCRWPVDFHSLTRPPSVLLKKFNHAHAHREQIDINSHNLQVFCIGLRVRL